MDEVKLAKDRQQALNRGELFLNQDFTDEMMESMLYDLNRVACDKNVDVITIFINSNGGATSALFPLVDWIERCPKPVSTVVLGKAYSAGAMLLLAGSKGYRKANKRSFILLHEVANCRGYTKASQAEEDAKHLKMQNAKMKQLIKDRTKMSKTQIALYMDSNKDISMDAKQALKYGIIDQIL